MSDLSLNLKIVIATNLFFILILSVQGAPVDLQNEIVKNCSDTEGSKLEESDEEYDLIDQRQNGTENYRIYIKDVALIWAPANSLLAATALLNAQLLSEELLGNEDLSELEAPQNGQNLEQSPVVLEIMENKPLTQNVSIVLPEKENETVPVINPLTKPVTLNRRNLSDLPLIGSFLRRKQ